MAHIPGMIRAMAAVPRVHLANPQANAQEILALLRQADEQRAELCVFPELCLCGYTCADLLLHPPLLAGCLQALETLLRAAAAGETVFGYPAEDILFRASLTLVPLVDPDGIDLVTGALPESEAKERTAAIAAAFPAIPYPDGWKANIAGIDLNLQYPAGWDTARAIKFAQGYDRPAPRDFVGEAPLTAPEAAALAAFTEALDPALVLAYHTQGNVIYWKYLNFEPEGSRALAERFACEDTPYASGFAGYKDWFIQNFDRPGYTIECGLGENPLPLSQFESIWNANLGILTLAALGI